jgi:glutathione S-transferase
LAFLPRTGDLPIGGGPHRYAAQLLALTSMKDWYAAALQETWRDDEHEVEARAVGEWLEDLRAR